MLRSLPVLALLLLTGCAAGANLGPGAEARRVQTREVSVSPDAAYAAAVQFAAERGWTVTNSDPVARVATTTTPVSMARWSDTVSIIVAERDGGGSTITARSTLAQGPNTRFVSEFLDALVVRAGE